MPPPPPPPRIRDPVQLLYLRPDGTHADITRFKPRKMYCTDSGGITASVFRYADSVLLLYMFLVIEMPASSQHSQSLPKERVRGVRLLGRTEAD